MSIHDIVYRHSIVDSALHIDVMDGELARQMPFGVSINIVKVTRYCVDEVLWLGVLRYETFVAPAHYDLQIGATHQLSGLVWSLGAQQ